MTQLNKPTMWDVLLGGAGGFVARIVTGVDVPQLVFEVGGKFVRQAILVKLLEALEVVYI